MLKLDFLNEEYELDYIKDCYTDGSLDNFKGDEDFLNFLVTWAVGEFLDNIDENYREWCNCRGFLNAMRLDEAGLLGKDLYRIYEVSGKDKNKFIKACDLIGSYYFPSTYIDLEIVKTNLMLKEPVEFFDDNIILSNNRSVEYDMSKRSMFRVDPIMREEFIYEQERSLRRRINESICKNGDDIPLVDETEPYVEMRRKEEEAARRETEAKRVSDDYEIDIDNLFFGSEDVDISGGILGMNMKVISWFERTPIILLGYHVFRSVPDGDYCLVDGAGKIHIPSEELKKCANSDVEISNTIRSVNIANLPTIFDQAISVFEQSEDVDNDELERYKGTVEGIKYNSKIKVGELNNYLDFVRSSYECVYGPMFKEKDRDYENSDIDNKSGTDFDSVVNDDVKSFFDDSVGNGDTFDENDGSYGAHK